MLNCKNFFAGLAFTAGLTCSLFAQSSGGYSKTAQPTAPKAPSVPSVPQMPSVTLSVDFPSMPKVSAPALGSPFYTPGSNKTTSDAQSSSSTSTMATTENTTASTASRLPETLSIDGALNHLTAEDVARLGQSGLFGGIYGLLGGTENSLLASSSTDYANQALLQNIQKQLTELKNQNEELKERLAVPQQAMPQTAAKQFNPRILRFLANGQDVLGSCRTVYFSQKENDGSFLLTGDRNYESDGTFTSETFYFLFRANHSAGASSTFLVEVDVMASNLASSSVLASLKKNNTLIAKKTGNLVSLRHTTEDFSIDLLLDLGS